MFNSGQGEPFWFKDELYVGSVGTEAGGSVSSGTPVKVSGSGSGGGSSVQSDWDQIDSTASDYIKNKPSLGTASVLDIPESGNASVLQVVKGDDTRLTDARSASDVYAWAKSQSKPVYTASEVGAIPTSMKGTSNGVAELDSNGKILSSQLPSYVDDVITYSSSSAFPQSGEEGKIYITSDTNKTYRWSGSSYVEISESLALGETSSTAYRGDRGKAAYDHSQLTSGSNPHNTSLSGLTDTNVSSPSNGQALIHNGSSWVNRSISELPAVTSSDNGKVLKVVNGAWSTETPVYIYIGSNTPDSSIGSDGDIYINI